MTDPSPSRRSTCPISSSLDVLGDRWSLLIVRDMLFGGARTFKDFRASKEKIATNILADRLTRLKAEGLIAGERDPSDGRSLRYRLTPKGLDLIPVLMELSAWGTRHADGHPPGGILESWKTDRDGFVARLRAAEAAR